MLNLLREVALTLEIIGEKVGDMASDFLHSDRAATYVLAATYLGTGLLLGYALARNLL